MMSIPSKYLIKKKEVLDGRWLKCIKFSGIITLKNKLHGRLKVISINIIRVFSNLSQVPLSLSPFIIQSRDEILFKGVGCDTLGVQNSLIDKLEQRGELMGEQTNIKWQQKTSEIQIQILVSICEGK